MKSKLIDFQQHLSHDVEDDEKAGEYIDEALPWVGLVVMYFNGLEAYLDSILCEYFTDRSDATGLIVLNKLSFGQKVELLKRFGEDFQFAIGNEIGGFETLIADLNESARLRNLVVHANWEATDEKGFTYVRLKLTKKGMKQEYFQFSEESFSTILNKILEAQKALSEYSETWEEILHERFKHT
jgi:hypothetical protein